MWYKVRLTTLHGYTFDALYHERKLPWLREMTFTCGTYACYSLMRLTP